MEADAQVECEKTLRDGLNAYGVAILTQETVEGVLCVGALAH